MYLPILAEASFEYGIIGPFELTLTCLVILRLFHFSLLMKVSLLQSHLLALGRVMMQFIMNYPLFFKLGIRKVVKEGLFKNVEGVIVSKEHQREILPLSH